MLKVVAKNYADLNQLDKILSLCRELVEITRGEKGCISYGVYQDAEHPELLTMIEEWKSREDWTPTFTPGILPGSCRSWAC